MTKVEEDKQSREDKSESINIGPIAVKDTEMGEEKPMEDKKEVGEGEVEGDEQEEDEDEETEDSEDEDEQDKKLQHSLADVSNDGRKELHMEDSFKMDSDMNIDSTVDAVENDRDLKRGNVPSNVDDNASYGELFSSWAAMIRRLLVKTGGKWENHSIPQRLAPLFLGHFEYSMRMPLLIMRDLGQVVMVRVSLVSQCLWVMKVRYLICSDLLIDSVFDYIKFLSCSYVG